MGETGVQIGSERTNERTNGESEQCYEMRTHITTDATPSEYDPIQFILVRSGHYFTDLAVESGQSITQSASAVVTFKILT